MNEARAYDVIDLLTVIAEVKGVTVPQAALAWLLHQRHVTSVIVGAKRIEQLDDNVGAVDVVLSPCELAPEYPAWILRIQSRAK